MKLKLTVPLVLILLTTLFALQNVVMVDIRFLFWTISIPRSLLIFLMLLIGIIIGWFWRPKTLLRQR